MQGLASAVGKPYLRTLFFRVLTLYRLGTSLVFVVDGEAVRLKWAEMERRERGAGGRGAGARGRGSGTGTEGRWKRNSGTRPQFNSKIKEVRQTLTHSFSFRKLSCVFREFNVHGRTDGT